MEPTPELREAIEVVKRSKNVSKSGRRDLTMNTHDCRDQRSEVSQRDLWASLRPNSNHGRLSANYKNSHRYRKDRRNEDEKYIQSTGWVGSGQCTFQDSRKRATELT